MRGDLKTAVEGEGGGIKCTERGKQPRREIFHDFPTKQVLLLSFWDIWRRRTDTTSDGTGCKREEGKRDSSKFRRHSLNFYGSSTYKGIIDLLAIDSEDTTRKYDSQKRRCQRDEMRRAETDNSAIETCFRMRGGYRNSHQPSFRTF